MSIANTITQLQALHAAIEGIKSAPISYTGSISTAQLPLVTVWPSRATTRQLTSSGVRTAGSHPLIRSERVYSARVYVEAVGQNDYDTPAQLSITLLDKFLQTYFSNNVLADGITEIINVQDTGVMAGGEYVTNAGLTYAGNQYKGFICNITVMETCEV